MQIEISVIIACYNSEKTIIRAIDSVPKNSCYEIVIVDDCSSDHSVEVIRNYIFQNPDYNIILRLNEQNGGAGLARNEGLRYATKEYVTFLDSDDVLDESFNEKICSLNETYDCIAFDAMHVSKDNQARIGMFYSDSIKQGDVNQKDAIVYIRGATWGKIYRRAIISEWNIKFGKTVRNEDLIFTKSCLAYCKTIYYLQDYLYYYTDNVDSLMNNRSLRNADYAIISVNELRDVLLNKEFFEEFNSIYYIELVYSTMKTRIKLGDGFITLNRYYNSIIHKYKRNDKYRKKYSIKFRVVYYLLRFRLFFIIKYMMEKK